jgi:hypothetical protein
MKTTVETTTVDDDMKAEYAFDYTQGVRGKYFERAMRDKGFVRLEPELMQAFPNNSEVNAALRGLVNAAKHVHLRLAA